jgi:cytoskeleton protein RodZ
MLQDRRSNLAEGQTMMSTVENRFPDEAEVFTSRGVGADLRAARERLGWSLPEISDQLRIRLPFLQAIEDGRISELPGNAYAVGFLRTYASAVGLDPDEISRRFRAEAAHVNRKTTLTFPAPVPERGVPAGAVVLLGVVVVVLAYAGWYRLSDNRRPSAEQVQVLPERLVALVPAAPPPVPVMPNGANSSGANAAGPKSGGSASSVGPAFASGQAAVGQGAIGQSVTNVPPSLQPQVVAAAPRPLALPGTMPQPILVPVPTVVTPAAGSAPASASPVLAADGTRIVVRAKAEAWVQVADKQGVVVLNRTLRAGETWNVPSKPGLFLTVGNAGGTELLVDGVLAPSLGADGAVRRNLSLDPDQVRDGKLAVVAPVIVPAAAGVVQAAVPPSSNQAAVPPSNNQAAIPPQGTQAAVPPAAIKPPPRLP